MNGRLWTSAEDRIMRTCFPRKSSGQVAGILGRSMRSVLGRAVKLGLHKTPEYLLHRRAEDGYRISSHPNSIAARIPKGHVPANKGLRRPGWFRGRMRETQFGKDHRPANYLPIGTIKPNADGYLRVKVSEKSNGRGANDKAWEFVHKRVWEMAYGPIPKGHRIWWKNKDHMNCALENLELLSGREHMARTTRRISSARGQRCRKKRESIRGRQPKEIQCGQWHEACANA